MSVLVVCPNVTIRSRLGELDPTRGEASLYRTRDLVPPHLMPDLAKGRVLVTNWHVFEPQSPAGRRDQRQGQQDRRAGAHERDDHDRAEDHHRARPALSHAR